MTPFAIVIGWKEVAGILGAMAALAAVGSFIGAWLGRHYKELAMVTQTRVDLDEHLKWAREKEEAFVAKMGAMQEQSIRNGEKISSLAEQIDRIAKSVEKTADSVGVLKGVVSTVFKQGADIMENGA